MNRYGPLLVLLAGVSIAVVIAAVELGRDDRLTDVASTVASATPTPAATPEPTAQSVRGRDEPFASNGREWARALLVGTHVPASPRIAVDAEGNLVVAAEAMGFQPDRWWLGTDFRPNPIGTPLEFHGGDFDIVLAGYTSDGDGRWARSFGGVGTDTVGDVVVASDGDILLSGARTAGFDFGDGPVEVDGPRYDGWRDGFLARLDAEGNVLWHRSFGFEQSSGAGALVELPNGHIVVSASTEAQEVDVGGTRLVTERDRHPFLVCFTAEGEIEWAVSLDADLAGHLTVDPSSGELVIALFERLERLDGSLSLAGLARVSQDGEVVHQTTRPASPEGRISSSAFDLAVSSDGTTVIAGTFEDQVDLGGGLLTADAFGSPYIARPVDGFVARFAPDGTHLMSRLAGEPGEGVEAMALTEDGEIVIAGRTYLARLSPDGEELSSIPFPETPPEFGQWTAYPGEASANRGNGASRLGTLLVDTRATEDGEVLVGGRFRDLLAFDFGGRILTKRIDDSFIARVEAP